MWVDAAIAALPAGSTLVILWLGAFAGAVAAGGIGFAFALTASAIWLHAFDPLHTTALIVASGTILHSGMIWPLRRAIEPSRLWPFVLGGVIGIPIGVRLLAYTDPGVLRFVLGIFLVLFGSYALAAPRLPVVTAGGKAADGVVGFIGGVLGGLGGYSGVLPTIWTQLRGWPKGTARAVYQPYIIVAHVVTLIVLGVVAMDWTIPILVAAALPALLAGAWTGWHIYGRLDDRRFRQILAVMLVISGLGLVL